MENPQTFLNSALEVASSPVQLMGMLSDRYSKLDGGERDMFVLSLIGHIAATKAVADARRSTD